MPGPYKSEKILFHKITSNGGMTYDQIKELIDNDGLFFYESIRDTLNTGIRLGKIKYVSEKKLYKRIDR